MTLTAMRKSVFPFLFPCFLPFLLFLFTKIMAGLGFSLDAVWIIPSLIFPLIYAYATKLLRTGSSFSMRFIAINRSRMFTRSIPFIHIYCWTADNTLLTWVLINLNGFVTISAYVCKIESGIKMDR